MNGCMRRIWCATLLAAVVAGQAGAGKPIVALTMTERLGLARAAEPVTIGVPLAAGTARDPAELILTDANDRPLAAGFQSAVRWPDGSIRWVHVRFAADCPAHGSTTVKLGTGQADIPKGRLDVRETADAIAVNTGPLRFLVKKNGFNLIDQAWFDGRPIIESHRYGAVVKAEGQEYRTGSDPDVQVEVEESSAWHVVIRASGAHRNETGERMLDFTARLYATAESPVVRVVYTTIMAQGGKRSDFVPLTDFRIELPTVFRQPETLFGTESEPKSARLGAGDEAFVLASDSDTIRFGGALSGTVPGKSAKPRTIGWAGVGDGRHGLAGGVRWFWQTHPKSVEITGEGLLRLGLYPARSGTARNLYAGVARTHEIQLVFHGQTDPAALAARFAGLEDPLRPFAEPAYYCATRAFGHLVEAGSDRIRPEHRPLVENWDRAFEDNWTRFDKLMDGRRRGGATTDDYGWLEWGDNFHYTKTAAWGRLFEWNGNYYGYPHMMAIQFVRTGHRGYFDRFEAHALHVADVHTVHHDPGGRLSGASRYCPPGDHVRIDRPPQYPVYVSNTFNHFKNESLFWRWYFLADHRMRDVLATQRRLVTEYKAADSSGGQPRGAGHLLLTLARYSEDGGEPVFLERMREVFRAIKDRRVQSKNGAPNFQQGIQLEGVRRYFEISGDPEALDYLSRWADIFLETGARQTTAAQAFGLLHRHTGDPRHFDLALQCIQRGKLSFNKEKDFAMTMRNGAYFFPYLTGDPPAGARP